MPVYALTANSAAGGEEFYKSYGFNGYLEKPVDGVKEFTGILKAFDAGSITIEENGTQKQFERKELANVKLSIE